MKIEMYCDEAHPDLFSSKNPQAHYLIIGSLWLRAEDRSDYKNAIHNKRKRYDRRRRVALVTGDYVVVIGISSKGKGRFITAFVADSGRTVQMIRRNPKWA